MDGTLTKIHLYELSTIEEQIRGDSESTFFHPSEVELNRTIGALLAEVERVKPVRVVFDSLSEMRMLADTPLRYRRQILQLKQFFAGRNCTVLFLDDRTSGTHDLAGGEHRAWRDLPEQRVARVWRRPAAIERAEDPRLPVSRRATTISFCGAAASLSSRGSWPGSIIASSAREDFPSGIGELDALLGGGLGRGTSSMFMGPPGTGKSTLALRFAVVGGGAWREGVAFHFRRDDRHAEEPRVAARDVDMEEHLRSGLIVIEQIDPAEISPGELVHRIPAVRRGGGRAHGRDRQHQRLPQCHARGAVSHAATARAAGLPQSAGRDHDHGARAAGARRDDAIDRWISPILRTRSCCRATYESRGEVKQALSVIKKRSGNHERTIREMRVDKKGIWLGRAVAGFAGRAHRRAYFCG